MGGILLVALCLRLFAAWTLSPHADEPASVLAAHGVAAGGVPILPSGTLYLHGATLSYLLAPLVLVGRGDLEDLFLLRLVSVAAGVAGVWLTYRLGRWAGGRAWVGVVAAGLVAIDPLGLQWAGNVRMYALLQALCLAIVWVFLGAVARPDRWRSAASLAGLFWLASFTHVGAATLWPPLAVVAVLVHGGDLWRAARPLTAGLATAAVAPVVVSLLPSLVGPENLRQTTDGSPLFGFAGADLLAIERLTDPSFNAWFGLFGNRWASAFAPLVLVAATGYLLGTPGGLGRVTWPVGVGASTRHVALLTLLATYWGGVAAVSLFTTEQHPRYLLHLQPLGALTLALAAATVVRSGRTTAVLDRLSREPRRSESRGPGRVRLATLVAVAAIVLPGLAASADGVVWRLRHPTVDVDYVTAMRYVAAHRAANESVFVALPPPAYLTLGGRRNLFFLAGTEGQARVKRYTRVTDLGRTVDYWVRAATVTDPGDLCGLLHRRPGAWLVVDKPRLNATWAYRGDMARMIRALTEEVSTAPGGVLILRALPPDQMPACDAIGQPPPADSGS